MVWTPTVLAPPSQLIIQETLNSLNTQTGGIVQLPSGNIECEWNFDVSSGQYYGFLIPSNVTLRGAGMFETTFLFPMAASETCVAFSPMLNASNWSLSNFGMNGSATDNQEVPQWVSRASDLADNISHDVVWDSLYVTQFGAGINAGGFSHALTANSYNMTVRNCVFHNTNNIKVVGGGNNLKITGNSFIQDAGLLDQGSSIGLQPISNTAGFNGVVIANNIVDGGNDFTIHGSAGPITNVSITGNVIQTRFGIGLLLEGDAVADLSQVTVTGNIIDASDSTVADAIALIIRNCKDVVVDGNLCKTGVTTSQGTIWLQETIENLVLTNNRVISQTASITLASGQTLTNAVITGNVTDFAVSLVGTNTNVTNTNNVVT